MDETLRHEDERERQARRKRQRKFPVVVEDFAWIFDEFVRVCILDSRPGLERD